MLGPITVITGLVLLGVLILGAFVSLTRPGKRVVAGTGGRPLPAGLARAEGSSDPPAVVVKPTLPHTFSGLTKGEAEDLLDRLEQKGQVNCELSYEEGTGFTIRCP
jgi:hypothetical protein